MKILIAALLVLLPMVVMLCIGASEQSTKDIYAPVIDTTIVVNIPGVGAVLGDYDTSLWTNQTFMQFKGIPFAESPSGVRRFKAPVARLPWRQIYDATEWGRRCPVITHIRELNKAVREQLDMEDCLNLCVYTKHLNAKQPVMFYIYGGGFTNGSSSDHPPRHLLEKDIVLVVPQYRIGALGWLATRSKYMPGNAPILDLLLALEWVQKHIAAFGGDPKNITVFGQSGGTASLGALLMSPKTPRGLIKRAILQSGSIFADWGIKNEPEAQVERICHALRCERCQTEADYEQCFSTVDVLTLLEATESESFAPVVGDMHGMLPQHPNMLMTKYTRAIPVMTGFTKHDGSFVLATYYDEMKRIIGNLNYVTVRQFASGMMNFPNDTSHLSNNLFTRFLFTPPLLESNDHKAALPAYFDLTSIIFMKSPVITFASHLLRQRLADVYLYSFDYEGSNTRFGYEFGNEHYPFNGGVHHSNDNIYIFNTHQLNAADTAIAKKMVDLWTSFASSGVPSIADESKIPPMSSKSGPYFHINTAITFGQDVLQEFTSALDDPNSNQLNRENIPF